MMNRDKRRLWLAALLLGGMGACAQAEQPAPTAPSVAEASLEAKRTQFFAIVNRIFKDPSAEHIAALEALVAELEAGGHMEPRLYRYLRLAYKLSWNLDQAQSSELRAQSQAEDTMPTRLVRLGAATVPRPFSWQVDREGVARQKPLFRTHGPQLIVTTDAHCGYSEVARPAVYALAKAQGWLDAITWLALPNDSLDLKKLERWQQDHPGARYEFVDRVANLGFVETWATPVFAFLRDGVVVEVIHGWPQEGRMAELTQAAAKIGLQSRP